MNFNDILSSKRLAKQVIGNSDFLFPNYFPLLELCFDRIIIRMETDKTINNILNLKKELFVVNLKDFKSII